MNFDSYVRENILIKRQYYSVCIVVSYNCFKVLTSIWYERKVSGENAITITHKDMQSCIVIVSSSS